MKNDGLPCQPPFVICIFCLPSGQTKMKENQNWPARDSAVRASSKSLANPGWPARDSAVRASSKSLANPGWPARDSAVRASTRSVASTSYVIPLSERNQPADSGKQKPKRSLTFKQRLKNLKDNLMYAADIKYCRKHNDLTRMNSLRSSIRSGRSPYANDYDETDALISNSKPKRRSRSRQPRGNNHNVGSRPATSDGRSHPVTPESRSRAVTPEAPFFRPDSPEDEPELVAANARPTPAARSRPPSPDNIPAEIKSRPTTPVFRQGGKAPGANYFRPRTPSAADSPSVYSPTSPPGGRHESAPLVRPLPEKVMAAFQDSPRSSYRSQQTLL